MYIYCCDRPAAINKQQMQLQLAMDCLSCRHALYSVLITENNCKKHGLWHSVKVTIFIKQQRSLCYVTKCCVFLYTVSITSVQNSHNTLAEMQPFVYFPRWRSPLYLIFKNCNFGAQVALVLCLFIGISLWQALWSFKVTQGWIESASSILKR